MNELNFRVVGLPAPQGSKKVVGKTKTGRILMAESSKAVAPWRDSVATAALEAGREQGWHAPHEVIANVTFFFRRPQHHYRTGRNAHLLRDNAPVWHSVAPDCDKLQRSTFDALTTSGVITDDARIVSVYASKKYAEAGQPTGAHIILTPAVTQTPERESA